MGRRPRSDISCSERPRDEAAPGTFPYQAVLSHHRVATPCREPDDAEPPEFPCEPYEVHPAPPCDLAQQPQQVGWFSKLCLLFRSLCAVAAGLWLSCLRTIELFPFGNPRGLKVGGLRQFCHIHEVLQGRCLQENEIE